MTFKNIAQTLLVGMLASGLIACNTTGSKTQTTLTKKSQKVKLNKQQIIKFYAGKTLRGHGYSTLYKADGSWANSSGKTGKWRVTSNGTLVMTGALNLSLAIYKHGSRFYHRNVKSGSAGYYTIS